MMVQIKYKLPEIDGAYRSRVKKALILGFNSLINQANTKLAR